MPEENSLHVHHAVAVVRDSGLTVHNGDMCMVMGGVEMLFEGGYYFHPASEILQVLIKGAWVLFDMEYYLRNYGILPLHELHQIHTCKALLVLEYWEQYKGVGNSIKLFSP